jgi:serine/threonine-protein kinase PpkA
MVYYATEFMARGDLAMRLKSGPVAEAVNFVAQVASGLTALHRKGIVHRDIKPNNILFKDEKTVVVADLGIAKDLSSSEALTLVGEILGTPYYMSPEQFNGRPVDPRSDMYSLGVVFCQLLTGAVPFQGNSFMEVVYKHNYDPMPALPAELSRFQPLVEKMLAKTPEQRYTDLSEFLADLIGVRT